VIEKPPQHERYGGHFTILHQLFLDFFLKTKKALSIHSEDYQP